jgi:hypothetical protein
MINFSNEDFVRALNVVAATEEGRIVFAMIKEHCNWDKVYLSSENPTVSHYYATMRGVYGAIREHINKEHLKNIEFNYQRKVEQTNDGTNSINSNRAKPLSDDERIYRGVNKPRKF